MLIRDIAVPGNRVGTVVEERFERLILCTTVYEMHFWESRWSTTRWVHMKSAKVLAKLQGFFNGKRSKVLVSESNDLPLSDKQSQLVLALVVELGKLYAGYLSSDGRSDVFDLAVSRQEMLEACIRIGAMLVMLERLQRLISMAGALISDSFFGWPGPPGSTYLTPFSLSHTGK